MTIREAIHNALEALDHSGFPAGGDVYDDLNKSLIALDNRGTLDDEIE